MRNCRNYNQKYFLFIWYLYSLFFTQGVFKSRLKKSPPKQARKLEFFGARKVFWNKGTLITFHVKSPAGKNFGLFSSRCLSHRCTQTGHNFSKIRALFWQIRTLFVYFQKRGGQTFSLPPRPSPFAPPPLAPRPSPLAPRLPFYGIQ